MQHSDLKKKTKNMTTPSLFFLLLIVISIANTNHAASDQLAGSIEIPTRIIVGAPNSPGQFMGSFRVGSPAQEFWLVADTGSHQTWMNCNYTCQYCPKRSVELKRERMFQAELSSSFKVVPCMSEFCENYRYAKGCTGPKTPSTPCGYEMGYGDGSTTIGIYANETVTVQADDGARHEKQLQDFLIGCTAKVAGDLGGADGLLGLGSTEHSFGTKAAQKFGNKFSYCWTDILKPRNNNKTYLNFGKSTPTSLLPNMKYTELGLEQPPYYTLKVVGISVNGVLLKIPSSAWDFDSHQGGFMIDSGLTLMVFVPHAYDPVMTALKAPLMKFNTVESSFAWGEGSKLDFCFNATGFDESMVPKLGFHFADGAQFMPPVRNYVVEVENGVKCLAIYRGKHNNVIGSIMQQGYHWEYNLASKKLGFAPSACA